MVCIAGRGEHIKKGKIMEGIFDKNRTWMKVVAVLLTFMLSFSMWSIPAYAAEGSGGYASAQIGFFGGSDSNASAHDADASATANDNGIVPFAVTYADADYTIHVGETVDITDEALGDSIQSHSWSVSNGNARIVTSDGNKATIEGLSAGEVTISHTKKFWIFPESTTTFTVLVLPAKVTASFDLNGGNGATPDAIGPEEVDTTITLPTAEGIARNGYTFVGWSANQDADPADPESGTIVAAGGSCILNDNVTFYAIWSKNMVETTYTVQHVLAGGKVVKTETRKSEAWVNDDPKMISITPGDLDPIDASSSDIEGYEFSSMAIDKGAITEGTTEVQSGSTITLTYVPRTDLSYTVNYLEQGTDKELAKSVTVKGQTFGITVPVQPISIEGYVAPAAQSITIAVKDNEVNFYYAPRTDLTYTVNYMFKGEDNTTRSIAEPKIAINQTFGTTITEQAIKVPGYVASEPAEQSITIGVEGNVITFYYTTNTNVAYTVRAIDEVGNVISEELVESGMLVGQRVTVSAPAIPGYALIGDASQLLELTDNNDVVEFRYAARGDLTYEIQYWDDETGFPIQDIEPQRGSGLTVGQKVDVSGMILSIPGYEENVSFTLNGEPCELEDGMLVISGDENVLIARYAKRTDLSYTVNYIDQDTSKVLDSKTEDGQTFKATVVEEAIDIEGYNKVEPIASNFEVGANSDENVIDFYYTKRTDLSYTVNYLEQGTDKVLHDPLTRNNQAFDAEVSEEAIDIEGYDAVAPESITFNVKVDAADNECTFYYTPRTDLGYTVNFLERGTNRELAEAETLENQTFGTVIDPEQAAQDIRGYRLSDANQGITIGATDNVLNLYYEKRTDLEYTVKCLLVKGDQEFLINEDAEPVTGQTFGDTVSVNAPVLAGYTLLADQPQSQDITIDVEGNVVEFRYALRADLEYTVLYVDQRTGSELLPSKTVTGQEYGFEVTETAPTIEGYELDNPDDATITIEIAEMGNLIQFIYVKVATLSYTVNYLDKDTDEAIADQKVAENQTFGDEATAQVEVIDIPGYAFASADKASITIGTDSDENVINLYYAKRADLTYTVNYLDSETNEPIKDALTVADQVFQSQVDVTDVVAAPESAIDGYNYLRSNVVDMLTIAADENVINLYYAKRADLSYTVNHLDADGNPVEVPTVVENVIFGTEVAAEDAAVEVVGYEYDADRASTLTVGTNADENVLNVYYKKRADLTYVVNYLELGADEDAEPLVEQKVVEGQVFGTTIDAADEVIDIDGYNYDSLSADQLVLTSTDEPAALNIYYTKRTDLSYTVKYLQEGTETEVRASETFEDQVFGTVITAIAPTDITGYTNVDPTEASITLGTGENVIVFYYEPVEGLSYTVNYVDRITGEPLAAAKTVDGQVFGTEVREEPISVKGYYPASEEAVTFTIGLENNVVTINYDVRTDLSYTVNYLEQGTDKELAEPETVGNQTYLDEVSAQAIDIDGYNAADPVSGTLVIGAREDVDDNVFAFYYTPRTDLTYTVNYLTRDADGTERVLETAKVVNGTDENPVTFGTTVTEDPIEIPGYVTPDAPESIVIALEGNDVNFYYTPRTDLTYTVNYLEQDTNNVLHEAKVVENQTFGDTIMLADEAIDIEGYSVVEPSGALTIAVEDNVIDIFYQKIDNLSYTVRYVDTEGTELLPSETVAGYAYGAQISVAAEPIDGYVPDAESKDLTIGLGENTVTFTYALRTDLSYTVNYVEVDTNILVAEALVVPNQTFGVEIAAEDVARTFDGFTFVHADRESFEIGTNEADNTITLYYMRNTNLSYTVRYVDADGESVIDDKVVGPEGADGVTEAGEVAFGETVSETAPDIKGYNLMSDRVATHVIDVSDNVITFTYEKRADLSYTVNYLEQGTDDVAVAEAKTVENVVFGTEVTEAAPEIAGYTLVGADEATITIGERDDITDNVINFYYEPITNLTYTVNYLEEDTNKPLRDPKTEAGQRMGATISTSGEAGFVIEGYRFVSVDPEELVIGVDSAANVINVYYAPIADLSYTVNFLDAENPSISLAESVTVNDVAYGTTVAVADAAKAIDGFVLDAENADFTVGLGDNQFNIYYQRRADMPYTINYLERDTDAVLAEPTQASDGVFEEMIYANDEGIAKAIDGYVFDDQS